MELDLEDQENLSEDEHVEIEDLEEDEDNSYVEESKENTKEKLPYNEWSAAVDREIGILTNHMETIETVGFETWFWDWWLEGIEPEEAALWGVVDDGIVSQILEDSPLIK